MTVEGFALWKFKTVEGILENFFSHDFTTTRFLKNGQTWYIRYDVRTLTCTIADCLNEEKPIIVSFKDLPNKLKELGVYVIRNHDRHANSYIPFTGILQ